MFPVIFWRPDSLLAIYLQFNANTKFTITNNACLVSLLLQKERQPSLIIQNFLKYLLKKSNSVLATFD